MNAEIRRKQTRYEGPDGQTYRVDLGPPMVRIRGLNARGVIGILVDGVWFTPAADGRIIRELEYQWEDSK